LLSHILVLETSLLRDSINLTFDGFQGTAHVQYTWRAVTEGGMEASRNPFSNGRILIVP